MFCLSGPSMAMENPLGNEIIGQEGDVNPQGADDIGAINNLLAGVYNDLADRNFLGMTTRLTRGPQELNLSYLKAPEKYGLFGDGGEIKIKRDNTRELLKNSRREKPLDPDEIGLLENLRNAIADENTLIYSNVYSAYPINEKLKENVLAKLDQILSIVSTINIDNEEIILHADPQLALRQSLEAINGILIRNDNLGEAKNHKGTAELFYLIGFNSRCDRTNKEIDSRLNALHQTFSKSSGSLDPFDLKDIENINLLRKAVVGAQKAVCDTSLKTITTKEVIGKGVLVKEFNKISAILNNPEGSGIKKEPAILEAMSVSDLPFLQKCKAKPVIDIATTYRDIDRSLDEVLGTTNAIAYLPVYKSKQDLVIHHQNLLANLMREGENALNNQELMKKVFMELSQLKMALQSFSEIPFKPTTAGMVGGLISEKLYLGKAEIDWRLVKIKITGDNGLIKSIDYVRRLILCTLKSDGEIQETIRSLEMTKKRNEQKILTLQGKDDVWILSLAGGGIRGKIAAQILQDIEKKGINVLQRFDYFAGTSVGGLIVSSLNIPNSINPNSGQFNAHFVAGLLEGETAAHIFPPLSGGWKMLYQGNSYAYSENSLQNLLISNFHYDLLSDMVKPTLLVANNPQTGHPVHLKSYGPESQDIYAWQAARATSAAPSYFPQMALYYNNTITLLEDGGVTENNPTFAALNEVNKLFYQAGRNPKRINILFIGTGKVMKEPKFGSGTIGASSHAKVLEASMERTSAQTEELVKERISNLRSKGIIVNYYYLNPQLMQTIELDDSSEPNLVKLRKAANDIIASPYYAQLLNSLQGVQDDGRSKYVNIWGPGQDQFKVTNID